MRYFFFILLYAFIKKGKETLFKIFSQLNSFICLLVQGLFNTFLVLVVSRCYLHDVVIAMDKAEWEAKLIKTLAEISLSY